MKDIGVWFRPSYVGLLGGDVPAALMLSQIVYWYTPGKSGKSKLRVKRHGRPWLAKSAKDWAAELGCTEKQARRCVSVLVEKGVIKTKVMRFNGTPTTHLYLVDPELHQPECLAGEVHLPPKATPFALGDKFLTETTSETTTENTCKEPACNATASQAKATAKASEEDQQQGEEEQEGKEDLAHVQITKANVLVEQWNALAVKLNEKPLTAKGRGQLKQFADFVGAHASPAIAFAFANWMLFSLEAKVLKGLSCVPARPTAGFVLAYCDVLINLMIPPKKPSKLAMHQPQPAYKIKQVEPEEKTTFTPEQIAAQIAQFDK